MRISGSRTGTSKAFCRVRPIVSGVFVLLLLILALLPAAEAANEETGVPAGRTYTGPGTDPVLWDAGAANRPASPTPSVTRTTPETPAPARQNRTSLVQAAKNLADRPKVTISVGLFYLIVAVAVAGLLAILFLLLRRGAGSPKVQGGAGKRGEGTTTVIEDPSPPWRTPDDRSGPSDSFPLALRKRFSNPEFIGEGGLARVFRAQDIRSGAVVAVKVPARFDETTGTHFTRDISLWQGLEHENIVRILSSNILPVPYIEMEYAESSLAALALPLPEGRAVEIVLGVARGLAFAHGKGIIHRDIKPENILLSANGVPKITDWGLGKAIADPRHSTVIGFSPAYAAPEQVAPHLYGRPGPATDIYQLGMLLCELLTGKPLFQGGDLHALNTALLETMPPIPRWEGRYHGELTRIILRCLAKRPEDRYPDVDSLIRALEPCAPVPLREK